MRELALARFVNGIWLACLSKHGINPPADCAPSDDEMADRIEEFKKQQHTK